MARKFLVSRVALAVALSSGLAMTVATPAMAAKKDKEKEAAGKFSPEFVKVAQPLQKAMNDAIAKIPGGKPTPETTAAAKQAFEAGVGSDGKAAFQSASAAATTPDDKNALGSMMRNYGIISQDLALKFQGSLMLLESGKLDAANVGMTNYDAGVTAYQLKDYANSAKYLKAAKDAGFVDSSGQLDLVLADAYKRNNNPEAALQMAKDDVAAAQAKGVAPSETALRSVLQQTYTAKQLAPSTEYAALLAQYYPGTWNTAVSVVRQLASLPRDQNLDLMRLMFLTGSMNDKRDYYEYLENVDPRAFPGEASKVMNDGISKGKLTSADVPDKANTEGRVAADKASLPATERDANKPGATGATVVAAGDVFLSYDQPAKAETFYAKAASMPGVDASKVALRLGMTQALQGKYADAEANFAKVTGTRQPVAKLWSAYAKGKAAPATAAAAPAAN
ncbi:outer membrane protein assembly factor BamD [Novosphingobium kaempferiae]|uniref:outer membrane protein assembly factor BamD n=1 Tax=Novosphingobium kaempferiae TaxID=2896849 RepID=UPI001E382C57|nr:outer membrane protein assembly factor BamD [Novosphingobium kaempferiae]